jgi:hypothetical protein
MQVVEFVEYGCVFLVDWYVSGVIREKIMEEYALLYFTTAVMRRGIQIAIGIQ